MTRPARAIIDTDAFLANYRYAKSLAPRARAVAVVKANAYGHGAVRLARKVCAEADAFGVACSEEAMELRESGIENPILLLEGVFEPDELQVANRQRLSLVVHSPEQVEWLLAARPDRPFNVWLKLDTGMHRLGFDPESFQGVYQRLSACAHVSDVVLMSHFARADETAERMTRRQLDAFNRVTAGMTAQVSLANSAAILAWPDTHGAWIRPGIMLYGTSPLDAAPATAPPLRPVMQLESALIATRDLAPGEGIGYGSRYVCQRPVRVGVVAIGYADGYPRHAVDGTPVAVNGKRTEIIGRVSMDMVTVDISHLPEARVGDRVELWGNQVSANEVARCSATIAYQLFTGITRRVPLHYR